jgi:formate dehydrogenase iron-sulfur subunit
MTPDTAAGPIRATLIDIANCIGCRACQVACKQWNERDGEQTQLEPEMGIQNPAVLSAKTYTLIAFHEMENPAKPGGLDSAYVMQRCLHCLDPACVAACPTTALQRQPDGPVSYDVDECIGCRRRPTGTRAPRRFQSARTAPTAPFSRRQLHLTTRRCPRMPPGSSPTRLQSRPA